ncbi:MAG: Protein-L-isoaspartate O-methyltransferase [Chloroflexi bacterium ADurb.Bin222]|nr:MAG: Protein-L-isoaspartate O-methyltransferase [Chloroflexi bacterium ADurb.Bin222]
MGMEEQAVSRMITLIRQRGVHDAAVLEAMRRVPRHRFVPEHLRAEAYEDYPLPIGQGQTISQPYIVALMTEALELHPGDRVLEAGTGSGYQAAILAEMGMEVYTVEIVPALYEAARALLAELGYNTVQCRLGDGNAGWAEHAPYAGIVVTAAPTQIPPALPEQLAEGGRLVIPVGPRGGYQILWKLTKRGGELHREDLGGVAFVPFV